MACAQIGVSAFDAFGAWTTARTAFLHSGQSLFRAFDQCTLAWPGSMKTRPPDLTGIRRRTPHAA
jgi:hypothetical protein